MDGPVIQAATQQALAGGFRLRDGVQGRRGDPRPGRRAGAADDLLEPGAAVRRRPVRRRPARRRGSRAHHARPHPGRGAPTGSRPPNEPDSTGCSSPRRPRRDARLVQAVEASRGFVYAVSTMGITGARARRRCRGPDARSAALRAAGATSTCVGLGISTGRSGAPGARLRRRRHRRFRAGARPRRRRGRAVARAAAALAGGTPASRVTRPPVSRVQRLG